MGRAGLTVVVLQSGDDLVRARADRATACFVLTNRFTMDTDEMDSITVLRALNVKSFNQDLQTFVQIIGASPVLGYTSRCSQRSLLTRCCASVVFAWSEPENTVHVVSAGVKAENVLCVNSVKLGLLGQSCVFPGFSTVITNLVRHHCVVVAAQAVPPHLDAHPGRVCGIFHGHRVAAVASRVFCWPAAGDLQREPSLLVLRQILLTDGHRTSGVPPMLHTLALTAACCVVVAS